MSVEVKPARSPRAARSQADAARRARSAEQLLRGRADRGEASATIVDEAIRARARRELADLDVRRSIIRLGEQNVPQRVIADLMGLSQAEISRRLKRRELIPATWTPREVILRRESGELSTRAMMAALRDMVMTSTPPEPEAGFDGGATSTGSAKQLAASYQDGLLKKSEYEQLRKSIRMIREPRRA